MANRPEETGGGGSPSSKEENVYAKDDRDNDQDTKTRATIKVGGTETEPVVEQCPDRLVAFGDEELLWDIDFASKALEECVEVQLSNFRHQTSGEKNPFHGNDDDRKNKGDKKLVRDKIQKQAQAGIYNYDIHLNGKLAVDPDIEIKESN